MKSTTAASRYAKALLELAIEQNKVEQVAGDMNYLLEANKETVDFQLFLNSPVVNAEKKIAVFRELFGQFEEVSLAFIQLITKNGRESFLPTIAESFDRQLKEHKGIVPVKLVTAAPLDASVKAAILTKVEGTVKGQLEVTEVIDENIIGGFIIQIDDKQIDASISSQINKLKQRLTR